MEKSGISLIQVCNGVFDLVDIEGINGVGVQGVGNGFNVHFSCDKLLETNFSVFLEVTVGIEHRDVIGDAFAFPTVFFNDNIAFQRFYVRFRWIRLNNTIEVIAQLSKA